MSETKQLSRRESRKLEVRSRIAEAALTLFAERGCEPVTVEEICEEAEVARKTFYNYYASKQELTRELSDAVLYEETENLIELALEKHDNTQARISFICGDIVENLARYGELERSLIHQALLDMSNAPDSAGQHLRSMNQAFLSLLKSGVEIGDISAKLDPEFQAEMIVGAISTIMLNWVHDAKYPVHERVKQLDTFIKHQLSVD